MRNVRKHARANTARDLADTLEIDDPRIRRSTADDQLRPLTLRDALQFVVIDRLRFPRNTIVGDFVAQAGKIQRMSVRQMASMREVHSENLIAVIQRREIHRHVRLRAAVRLYVRMISAKQLLRAIDGRLLDDVGPFAAAVITLAGIAFGVLVRKHRAHRFKYGFADEVLAGDQFQSIRLARNFVVNGVGDQWINFGERQI